MATAVDSASVPCSHTWYAKDFVTYLSQRDPCTQVKPEARVVDVIVIGSGYGGAAALRELSGHAGPDGQPLKLLLLERGEAFQPGAFPATMSDLAGHVRVRTRPHQLFDFRPSGDLNVLAGCGLGGGSLINAGVMIAPDASVFTDPQGRWPQALRHCPPSPAEFEQMARDLQARPAPQRPGRARVMQGLAGPSGSTRAHITVATADEPERGVSACTQCGDCFTGCNVGAKLSLDVTLLRDAVLSHPAGSLDIVTGAHVEQVEHLSDGLWLVHTWPSDPKVRAMQPHATALRARSVIIAAGVLGSTEIMLRSQRAGLRTSPSEVGRRVSANGDGVATLMGCGERTQAVADPDRPLDERDAGPTITEVIDLRQPGQRGGMLIEELGVPAPMRRAFEELIFGQRLLHRLTQRADQPAGGATEPDPAQIDARLTDASLLLALIGHDRSDGVITLNAEDPQRPKPALLAGLHNWTDERLHIQAPSLKADPSFDERHAELARRAQQAWPDAVLLPHPSHRPVPDALAQAFGAISGPLITVHPLGGCAMGDDGTQGVVNHLGQVFRGAGTSVHPNLLVLDGAMVPSSLGVNPALTIATLARRAMQRLLTGSAPDSFWQGCWPLPVLPPTTLTPRPRLQPLPAPGTVLADPTLTRIELAECLEMPIKIRWPGGTAMQDVLLQLTLCFKPIAIRDVIRADSPPPLTLALVEGRSLMRIFARPQPGAELGEPLLITRLSGTMDWMTHERHDGLWDHAKAAATWLRNRGLSDITKGLIDRWRDSAPTEPLLAPQDDSPSAIEMLQRRVQSFYKLATHASHKRWMHYKLTIGEPVSGGLATPRANWVGQAIVIDKGMAYQCNAHPLRQLLEARLTAFPHRVCNLGKPLAVDLGYTQRVGFPLIRVVQQTNQITALADLTALLLYMVRALLPIHAWSLRLPDVPQAAEGGEQAAAARRLPQVLPQLPPPQTLWVPVRSAHSPPGADGPPRIHLSRYHRPPLAAARRDRPVLLIHGYSASGSTFAHPSLPHGGLAGYLAQRGHDVWVVDLRTSPGIPNTATEAWRFTQVADADIHVAVQRVLQETGANKLHVVAHCMGAAMLTLSLLDPPDKPEFGTATALAQGLDRIVMSQVTPTFVLSPTNVARAHIFQWLRYYTSMGRYDFTPQERQPFDDILDQLFALVPYPAADFARENPSCPPWQRTPWVLTRHRMDALYGQTFKLANMPSEVLAHLDDFFGPMSLSTLSEVIRYGRNHLVSRKDRREVANQPGNTPGHLAEVLGGHPVLTLHSEDNGLVDPRTMALTVAHFRAAQATANSHRPVMHEAILLEGQGHQDALIGRDAAKTFAHIARFLD